MELTKFGLLLAKAEGTYGTDPTPTAAANNIAIARGQVTLEIAGDVINRDILNNDFVPVVGITALPNIKLSFRCELRGNRTTGLTNSDISNGTSGQAIEIDPLLQACDLNPTYTAATTPGTSRDGYVTYKPTVPTDFTEGKSVTFYFYSQGKLYKITGAKGDLSVMYEAGKFAYIDFVFNGLFNAPVDSSIPGSISWLETKPPVVGQASGFTIDSYITSVISKLDFKLGNSVVRRDSLNSADGIKGFIITNRASKLTADPESVKEATHPFWADWRTPVVKTIVATVAPATGSDTGNKVVLGCKARLDKINYSDSNGRRIQNFDASCAQATLASTPGQDVYMVFE